MTANTSTSPLPVPGTVRRYFDVALQRGARDTRSAELAQEGEFLLWAPRLWRPFTAVHRLTVAPPGFVWEARVRVLPGVAVHVRDAFTDGVGSIEARLLDAVTLTSMQGTPEVALGSLQRYLAEAPWCPAALLPSNGVVWVALEKSSARAFLTAGDTCASLDFHFNDEGLVERVYTASRPRIDGRRVVGTPWQGRFGDFVERDGMVVPLAGEVEWLLPDGPQPYWRGRITAAAYERGAEIHA